MTTEDKALALVNEVQYERWPTLNRDFHMHEVENGSVFIALCRAIEAHEAFAAALLARGEQS